MTMAHVKQDEVLSKLQLESRADRIAGQLNLKSRQAAFRKLDRGDFDGTMAEIQFTTLRDLISSAK